MTIKHMPSGLFPHFDSALERRPYFVRAGEEVRFGCRLDGSEASSVWMEITDRKDTYQIPGQYHSVKDRGQRYFHFTHITKENDNTFTYRFVTSDQEVSKDYECPVLREITLYPEISTSENVTYMTFRTDTQEYRLEIQRVPCIRIILTSYLTVKIDSEQRNTKPSRVQSDPFSISSSDGSEILRINPILTMMVDEKGRPHNIRLHIEFPGSAVYGLGEKFDTVNQVGKKPLNTGILMDRNSYSADAYLRYQLFTPVVLSCRVDDRTLAALKLSEVLSTEEGETVTLDFSSSRKNADGTTDIRLHIESDQYRFGQELDELRILTGRVFQNVIVLPSSCVYQKEQREDALSYVRQVTETGLFLSELEVKTGYSDGNLICVSGISEGGWYDTGYKAVTEGKSP